MPADKILDLTQETSTVLGLADCILLGATAENFPFSTGLTNGQKTYIVIKNTTANEIEMSLSTFNSSTNSFDRGTILLSSNENEKVNFTAGTKYVYAVAPATYLASLGGTPAGSNTQIQYNDNGALGADNSFRHSGAGNLQLGEPAQSNGQVILANASNTFQSLVAPNSAPETDVSFFLPPNNGTAGNPLITDGSGNLSYFAGVYLQADGNGIHGITLNIGPNPNQTPMASGIYANNIITAWGFILADGTYSRGFGNLIVNKTGTGTYQITVQPALNTNSPVIAVIQGTTPGIITVNDIDPYILFSTFDLTGTPADYPFYFMATGDYD